MYHNFFIHSSVDGHLGCFHDLAIVNSAAMNIRVHVSFWIRIFVLSGYMPKGGIAGSYCNSIFSLRQKPNLSPASCPPAIRMISGQREVCPVWGETTIDDQVNSRHSKVGSWGYLSLWRFTYPTVFTLLESQLQDELGIIIYWNTVMRPLWVCPIPWHGGFKASETTRG